MISPARWWYRGVIALGIVITGTAVLHVCAFDTVPTITLHSIITLIVVGGSGIGLVIGGYWYRVHPLIPEHLPRLVAWIGASAVLFVSIGVITLYVGSRTIVPVELFEAVHITSSIGITAGLLVGTIHIQEIQSAEAAAHAEAKAEALAAQQERIEELNDLLRHYVLNGMQIITGYTDQLRETVSDENQRPLDTIDERTQAIVTLVEHMRSISRPDDDIVASGPTELTDAVRAIAVECDADSEIKIDLLPESPQIRHPVMCEALPLLCDGLMSLVASDGTVSVEYVQDTASERLVITATPLVERHQQADAVFDPGGEVSSVELYLAKLLVDKVGELRVREQSADLLQFELIVAQTADQSNSTAVA